MEIQSPPAAPEQGTDHPDAGFTPGPWAARRALHQIDGEYDYAIAATVNGRLYCIAEVFGRVGQQVRPPAEPNALLIAAAPELYGALKSAEGYLLNAKIDLETGAPKRTAITTIEGGLKVVRAALAKATGAP